MRNESGTIAAISTAMSNSGIGIVRMSGEESVEIAERIYKGKNEKKLSKQPTQYHSLRVYCRRRRYD